MKKTFILIITVLVICAGCAARAGVTVTTAPSETPQTTAPQESAESPSATVTVTPEATELPSVTPSEEPSGQTSAEPAETQTPAIPVVGEAVQQSENGAMERDIRCPDISGMQDEAMQAEVNKKTFDGLKAMADGLEARAAQDTDRPMNYYMNSGFAVGRNDGTLLSISVSIEYYAGGANVGTDARYINILNTKPAKELKLSDLFAAGTDYISKLNALIKGQIAASPEMSQDMTFSTVADDQSFYLTGTELVITFPSYSIAPGAYGMPEFRIPLSAIGGMLIPGLG